GLTIDHINDDKWNKNELKHLRVEFANSPDILAEIEFLSQRIISPQGSGNSHTDTSRKETSCFYGKKYIVPFTVIIERIDSTATNLNPVTVRKMLCSNPKYRDIKIVNINRKGFKRVGIQVGTKEQAFQLVRNNDFDPEKFDVYIPAKMVFIIRIVRDIGTAINENDIILNDISVNSEKSSGNPHNLVVQCDLRSCFTQKLCRGKFRCANCGGNDEEADKCKYETKCLYCKQGHTSKDRLCSEYMRQ
ncbi:hypothetical protein HHI36_001224, partial [Cryptolaemus montrouzieri]